METATNAIRNCEKQHYKNTYNRISHNFVIATSILVSRVTNTINIILESMYVIFLTIYCVSPVAE